MVAIHRIKGTKQNRPYRALTSSVSAAVCVVLLLGIAGCIVPFSEQSQALDPQPAKGWEWKELDTGARASYKVMEQGRRTGSMNVSIEPPTTIHPPDGAPLEAVPIVFQHFGNGTSSTAVVYVSRTSGKLQAFLKPCSVMQTVDGLECFPLRNLLFAGRDSPPPYMIGALDAFESPPSEIKVQVFENGKPRDQRVQLAEVTGQSGSGACWRLSPSQGWISEDRFGILFSVPSLVDFCPPTPFPRRIEHPIAGLLYDLEAFEPGTGSKAYAWSGGQVVEGRVDGEYDSVGVLPPTGQRSIGNITIEEAYDYARGNDQAFAAFLDSHPKARLRGSLGNPPGGGAVLPAPAPIGNQTLEQGFQIGIDFSEPGAREFYHIQVQKTRNAAKMDVLSVTESQARMGAVPAPRDLTSSHRTIANSFEAAANIIGTEFQWLTVRSSVAVRGQEGSELPLDDRYHYEFFFQGFSSTGDAAAGIQFPASVIVDSRTGAIVRVIGPVSSIEKMVPVF